MAPLLEPDVLVVPADHVRPARLGGFRRLPRWCPSDRAIRCAESIGRALDGLGLSIRAGVHTGEVELLPDDVAGIAVHTAARIMGEADPHEILVSSLVRDLAAGSGIDFVDRGVRPLRGIQGDWQLLAAST